MRRPSPAWVVVLLSLGGCDAPNDSQEAVCKELDPTLPTVAIEVSQGSQLLDSATRVTVRGTAAHQLGLSIRRITVAGIEAVNDSFNFAAWSADMPGDLIRQSLPAGAWLPTDAELEVLGYEPCAGALAASRVTISVRVAKPPPDGGAE